MRKTTSAPFEKLVGRIAGDIRWRRIDRLLLATDASIFFREPAGGGLSEAHRRCGRDGRFRPAARPSTVHPRGSGSGLCGSALGSGIVVDFTRHMNRLLHIDPASKTFTCEPGYRFGELAQALKGRGTVLSARPFQRRVRQLRRHGGDQRLGRPFGLNTATFQTTCWMPRWCFPPGKRFTLSELGTGRVESLPEPFGRLAALYRENRELIESAYPGGPLQRGRIQSEGAGQGKPAVSA